MASQSSLKDTVLTIAGILAILLIARYAKDIVVPFLLSLFFAIILAMPVSWLKKKGFSTGIAIITVLTGTLLIQAAAALLLGASFEQFNDVLPVYQERILSIELRISQWLVNHGINLHESGILSALDPKSVLNFANFLMSGVGEVLGDAVLIMTTVLFMLFEGWNFPTKIHAIKGIQSDALLDDIGHVVNATKHYIATKTVTSLATGVAVWFGLMLVGLDFAIIWGFLAFLLNYIPNIGSIVAAVPAVLLAVLQLDPFGILMVITVFIAANGIIGGIIEPGIMGRTVGLSTLAVFLSLVFWGWLLGPVGMLLSVPLTMVIKFAAQANNQLQWLAILLGPLPEKPGLPESVNSSQQ